MEKLCPYISVFILLFLFCECHVPPDKGQPNIIFFVVDDMGWQDTSVPFWHDTTDLNRYFHTPNMEKLVSEGMKFTQAYACSICSPTRTSIMTGMNAARHRVTNWTLRKDQTVDAVDEILSFPNWNLNGLQPTGVDTINQTISATVLPHILKGNGYFTIHSGKAHWGAEGTPGSDPTNLGFDVNIGGHYAGGTGSFLGEHNFSAVWRDGGDVWDVPGLEKYHGKAVNLTDVLTWEAVKALDTALSLNKPFYLYMSHYAVHVPYAPHDPYYQKYIGMGYEEKEALYAAMVEGMDGSLGLLMRYLEAKGIVDNTIILFVSDNGGLSSGARGLEPYTHNLPLKSGKGSAYEGGIRVPMIVKWPGVVKPSSVCDEALIIEDFFPSILEIAGINDYQTQQVIDGKSFVSKLKRDPNKMNTTRNLFWHFPNKWGGKGPGIGTTSSIRSGDWKLVYWYKDQHFDLFNIKEDIGEHENLVDKYPEKVRELSKELGTYLRSVDAQRPSFKSSGELVPWPDEVVIE